MSRGAGPWQPPLPPPRLGRGLPKKAPPRDAPGTAGPGGGGERGAGPRRGPRRTGGGGLGGGVPRVRVVVPPRVSPLRPPGSSPWWLHQEPVPALVVGGDVDVFSARLLGGEAPSVDVVGAFLLLVRVRPFLLQLLPFVFRPPVLEPHFHLGESEERTGARWGPGTVGPQRFPFSISPEERPQRGPGPCGSAPSPASVSLPDPSPAAVRRMGPGAQHPGARCRGWLRRPPGGHTEPAPHIVPPGWGGIARSWPCFSCGCSPTKPLASPGQ